MTKNKKFYEIKLAMKAGHYENLTLREKKIYKNAFKNGYRLSQSHIKKEQKVYIPKKIVGISFAKPSSRIVESIINKICIKYEVHKKVHHESPFAKNTKLTKKVGSGSAPE